MYASRIIEDNPGLMNLTIDQVQKITPQIIECIFRKVTYCFEPCRDIGNHHVEQ